MSEETGKGRGKKLKKQPADLLEIVGRFSSGKSDDGYGDEISRLIDEQIKMKAKEYKMKLLEKMSKQLDKEISELDEILEKASNREKISITTPSNHIDIDVRVATELAKLSEEDRKKVIETYAMLRAAERNTANPNMLLPLLIGFTKENKESTSTDLYQWGKLQLDTMKTAWDMAKTGEKPKNEETGLKLFLDIFKEMMEKDREMRKLEFEVLMKKMEEINQPSIIETLLYDKDTRNTLKELGLFNPPKETGMDPRLQIQLEQLRMQHEKEMKKMDMEMQLKLQELRNEQNKLAAMLRGIRQIGVAAADALTSEEVYGEAVAEQQAIQTKSKVVTMECPTCKGRITFPSDAKTVKCPSCNSVYRVQKRKEENE